MLASDRRRGRHKPVEPFVNPNGLTSGWPIDFHGDQAMTALYQKLKALDEKIAQTYYDITKDDPNAEIDRDGVERLFAQATYGDDTIDPNGLDALIAIVKGANFNNSWWS
jgi:hypothetical protein